jgi:hypothetical protein
MSRAGRLLLHFFCLVLPAAARAACYQDGFVTLALDRDIAGSVKIDVATLFELQPLCRGYAVQAVLFQAVPSAAHSPQAMLVADGQAVAVLHLPVGAAPDNYRLEFHARDRAVVGESLHTLTLEFLGSLHLYTVSLVVSRVPESPREPVPPAGAEMPWLPRPPSPPTPSPMPNPSPRKPQDPRHPVVIFPDVPPSAPSRPEVPDFFPLPPPPPLVHEPSAPDVPTPTRADTPGAIVVRNAKDFPRPPAPPTRGIHRDYEDPRDSVDPDARPDHADTDNYWGDSPGGSSRTARPSSPH